MAAPTIGAGVLRVVDRLQDASYCLFQPVVNVQFPATITAGPQTIAVTDPSYALGQPSFYVGAYLVCGLTGANLEVVQITAVNPGVSFSATFANAHQAGEWINGATFPVRYPTDQLLTQAEMLTYISNASNDFLTDCPLAYNVQTVTAGPSQPTVALPDDSLFPVRVAYQNYPLKETSQSNLDAMNPTWNVQGLNLPRNYYRDKIGVQKLGVWPVPGNNVSLEVVYSQRQAQTLGWGDGWIVPDVFTTYILFRTLEFAFSKDGEIKNPTLARYFGERYKTGVKISNVILGLINDPSI